MSAKFIAPKNSLQAFHCPHCGVLSHMVWGSLRRQNLGEDQSTAKATPTSYNGVHAISGAVNELWVSYCTHCKTDAVWLSSKMIHPRQESFGPIPAEDMPADIRKDFEEAREIAQHSPRGAAALVRLCLQKLCKALGEKGANINDDIGNLVKKGLDAEVQEALDAVRVIGNNAVHPGTIDLTDDAATVEGLMEIVNYVVDAMITQPKKRKALFNRIPEGIKAAIAKRDAK